MSLSTQDYIDIQQLYSRFCFSIDMHDYEGYAKCYARDGSFVSYDGATFEGFDALRDLAATAMAKPGMKGYHWCSNLEITPADDGASGRCYLMHVFAEDDQSPEVRRALYYIDEMVQEDGSWVFRRREVRKLP